MIAGIKILFVQLLLALPIVVQAQFTFTTNNGTLTITGYTGTNGVVTLPSSTNGYPVTIIGNSAFNAKSILSDVTIPSSITNVGSSAFWSCTNLTNITIGTGVISIGNLAFARCSKLASILIPASVAIIVGFAFADCSSLTSIVVDGQNTVYSSSNGVLFDKNQSTLIQFPSGAAGSYAVPGGVRVIGTGAFQYCNQLTDVTLPPNLTNIASQAFGACSNLTAINVDITNPVYASVEGVLFDRSLSTLIVCPGGTAGSYAIASSVTNIADYAFYLCGRLTNVVIPSTVTTIGYAGFFGCQGVTDIVIPSSITKIGASAFGATGLMSIKIPDSVTNIPDSAFFGCDRLTDVLLPGRITSIGANAFQGCPMTSIIIPASVLTINNAAFFGCFSLKSVFFRGNAPGVGSSVFSGANNATVYRLPGTTGWGATYGGRPTAIWTPQVQTSDGSFGVLTNEFGFNITWASGMVIVAEACTNLNNPTWSPLQTNTLSGDSLYFSDPNWTNYPDRFYRIRSP